MILTTDLLRRTSMDKPRQIKWEDLHEIYRMQMGGTPHWYGPWSGQVDDRKIRSEMEHELACIIWDVEKWREM